MATTSWDTHKNLAISAVATAPSPAASGLTVTVTTGQGSRFAGGMNATICPAGTTPDPTNSEIVRIASVSGDVLTLSSRGAESSTARTVVVGDVIFAGPSVKSLTDIEGAVGNLETLPITTQAASYTLVGTDAGKVIQYNSSSPGTMGIASDTTMGATAHPVGTQIVLIQVGTGALTIAALSGTTLNGYAPGGSVGLAGGQGAALTLLKTAASTWYVFGSK
jgi:hypothetical protein